MKAISSGTERYAGRGSIPTAPEDRMDIRQLRTFVTVAQLSSVTKAAEALHITQPAVSGQLKALEDELQVRLLSRTTSSVTLTQSGQALLARAEQAIEAFGSFTNLARSLRGQIDGQFRLGVVMLDPLGPAAGTVAARHGPAPPGAAHRRAGRAHQLASGRAAQRRDRRRTAGLQDAAPWHADLASGRDDLSPGHPRQLGAGIRRPLPRPTGACALDPGRPAQRPSRDPPGHPEGQPYPPGRDGRGRP
ncbi:LysR family transcriptional regulator (plasmid) [Paracoccus yeei]|uniref:LysR family transcriptional regulator n=1 Tax=Paracoccus yeei TaxID=147645 RepID=A0A5P2QWZ0_9RHOB|nr:LysR family transcriptional regulator [Paracoccus yeei]